MVLAALRAATPIGIAGYYVPEGSKTAHKGIVWGAFVRPEARNGGVGRKLIEALIAEATGQVELLHNHLRRSRAARLRSQRQRDRARRDRRPMGL